MKRFHPVALGKKHEKDAFNFLSNRGYQAMRLRHYQTVWDLIGFTLDEIVLIQVKLNGFPNPKLRRQMINWPAPANARKQIYIYYDDGTLQIFELRHAAVVDWKWTLVEVVEQKEKENLPRRGRPKGHA